MIGYQKEPSDIREDNGDLLYHNFSSLLNHSTPLIVKDKVCDQKAVGVRALPQSGRQSCPKATVPYYWVRLDGRRTYIIRVVYIV